MNKDLTPPTAEDTNGAVEQELREAGLTPEERAAERRNHPPVYHPNRHERRRAKALARQKKAKGPR